MAIPAIPGGLLRLRLAMTEGRLAMTRGRLAMIENKCVTNHMNENICFTSLSVTVIIGIETVINQVMKLKPLIIKQGDVSEWIL